MKIPVTNKRLILIPILTVPLILGISGCDDDDEDTNTSSEVSTLKAGKICTGFAGGTYYSYAGGVIEAAKDTLGFNLENVATQGSIENAQKIASDECDMAIVQADIYIQTGTYLDSSPELKLFSANMGSVAALYKEPVHILVNKNSGITSIADLGGKKVNIDEEGSGTYFTATKILNSYTFSSPPNYFNEARASAVEKVANGTYDATFYVAATPIPALADLPADANVTLIPATIRGGYTTDYTMEEIPATTYPWLYSNITNNVTVWSLLAIGSSIDRTKLVSFLDTIYANKNAYAETYHAKWSELERSSSINTIKTMPTAGWGREAVHYFANASLPTVEPQPYFCSAGASGIYTKVVKDLLPIVESTLGITLGDKNTNGSIDNLNMLYTGECAMAIIQDDMGGYMSAMDQASPGIITEIMLKGQSPRAIMAIYTEQAQLIVNENSGINSSAGIVGKKFNMAQTTSGSYMTASTMLLINGLSEADVIPFYEPPQDALSKVISGEYDAMFVTLIAPVEWLTTCPDGATSCYGSEPKDWPIKQVKIESSFGSYVKANLPASYYPWQDVDVPDTPQTIATVFVSPNLSLDADRVAKFIEAVYQIPADGSTNSTIWNQTTLEQGINHFKLVTYLYDWYAGQYFAGKM